MNGTVRERRNTRAVYDDARPNLLGTCYAIVADRRQTWL